MSAIKDHMSAIKDHMPAIKDLSMYHPNAASKAMTAITITPQPAGVEAAAKTAAIPNITSIPPATPHHPMYSNAAIKAMTAITVKQP
jgi:hypothetical protein